MPPRNKRANGEGSIYKLDDGRWRVVVKVGQRLDGRMIRRSKIVSSHADARAVAAMFQQETQQEYGTATATLTMADYLDRWLEDTVKPNVARNTYNAYRQQARKHVKPRVGKLKLRTLNALHVQEFVASMQRDNVPPSTRSYAFKVLKNALMRAEKLGLIQFNPCRRVDTPRYKSEPIVPFTEDEAMRIMEAVEETSLEAVYVVAFSTGLRQGELFGAWWEDLDLRSGIWNVRRQIVYSAGGVSVETPKTPGSIRKIELTSRAVDALRERQKIALADGHAACKFVFCTSRSLPMRPTSFHRDFWVPLLDRLKIERRGFHHTRHSYATLALSAGVPVTVVAHVLGHATPATTLKFYSHYLPSMQQQSTAAMKKLFG